MATRSSKAEDLNRAIGAECPAALSMLSARGRAIYFPYAGILGQSAEAKGKKYNATIGIALEEDKTPMRLACLMKPLAVDPAKVLPYAPSFGLPELRARWKELMLEKNPGLKGKAVSLPVVTQALTHGLAVAAYLFLEAGEEILFPEPYWTITTCCSASPSARASRPSPATRAGASTSRDCGACWQPGAAARSPCCSTSPTTPPATPPPKAKWRV